MERGRLSESERDTETALISWLAPLRCMLKTQGRSLMQVAMNQLLAPSPVTSQGLHCQEAGVGNWRQDPNPCIPGREEDVLTGVLITISNASL